MHPWSKRKSKRISGNKCYYIIVKFLKLRYLTIVDFKDLSWPMLLAINSDVCMWDMVISKNDEKTINNIWTKSLLEHTSTEKQIFMSEEKNEELIQ